MNSCWTSMEGRFCLSPRYNGSFRFVSLSVPQSKTIGKVLEGWIPASSGVQSQLANLSSHDYQHLSSHETRLRSVTLLECTYRNTNTVHAQVAETQNPRPISDDTDLGVGARPVSEHGANGSALLDGDVQGFGAGIDARVLQADVANSGCCKPKA